MITHRCETGEKDNSDVLKNALITVCEYCEVRNCLDCQVFSLRMHAGLKTTDCGMKEVTEQQYDMDLPDTFAFQTKINQLTQGVTYYAEKRDGQYVITLPKIGDICCFSVENMQEHICRKEYVLLVAE